MAVRKYDILSLPYLTEATGDVSTYRPGEGPNGWDAVAVEVGTTNLFSSPQDLETDWTGVRATLAAASSTDPPALLPGVSVDSISEDDTATSTHYARSEALTLDDNTVYTNYAILKASNRTWASLKVRRKDNGLVSAWFDLVNGEIGTPGGAEDSGIISLGDGWFWCWLSVDVLTGVTTPYAYIYASEDDNDDSYNGLDQISLYHAHSQLEALPYPTSPVVGSRAAGQLAYLARVIEGHAFALGGHFSSTPGETYATANRTLFATGTGAADGNNVIAYISSADDKLYYSTNGGAHEIGAAQDWSDDFFSAVGWNGSTLLSVLDGVAGADASLAAHTPSYLAIGNRATDLFLNGLITDFFIEMLPDGITEADFVDIMEARQVASGSQLYGGGDAFYPLFTVTLPPHDRNRTRNQRYQLTDVPNVKLAEASSPVKQVSFSWSGLTLQQFEAFRRWLLLFGNAPRKFTLTTILDTDGTFSSSALDLVLDQKNITISRNSSTYGFGFSATIAGERTA